MFFCAVKRFLSYFNRFGLVRVRCKYSKIYLGDLLDSIHLIVKKRFGDELVLEVKYKGLGDHLFYSALPEKLILSGKFKKVYISNYSQFRFPDIKHIVWDLNPYISGFIDKKGWSHSGIRPENGNFVDGINHFFNTQMFNDLGQPPKIYYKPNFIKLLEGKVLIDLGAFSNKDLPDINKIKNYISQHNILDVLFIKSDNCVAIVAMMKLENVKFINLPDKFSEYCDFVWSCKKFICLYSGGNSLAPALGKKAFVICKFFDPAQSYNLNEYIVLN